MAQLILKFQEGGSSLKKESDKKESPKKNILKRGSSDEIDRDNYVAYMETNFENWLKSTGYNSKEKEQVRTAYRLLVEGINDGTITPDSVLNKSHDSKGRYTNTSDKLDPYGIALSFIHRSFWEQDSIKPKDVDTSTHVYNPSNFASELNKILFRGNSNFNPDFLKQDAFDKNTKKRGYTNRAKLMSDALLTMLLNINNDKLWLNTEESLKLQLTNNITELISKLSDGNISDDELMYFSNLGISPNLYFYTGEEYETDNTSQEREKTELEKEAEIYQKTLELRQLDALRIFNLYNQLPDNITPLNFYNYKNVISPWDDLGATSEGKKLIVNEKVKENILNDLYNRFVLYIKNNDVFNKDRNWWTLKWNGQDFVQGKNYKANNSNKWLLDYNWSNLLVFSFLMNNYFKRHTKTLDPNGFWDNKHIISTRNGYAHVLDPTTGLYSKVPVYKIPNLIDMLPELSNLNFGKSKQDSQQVESEKQGGILKAQFGNILEFEDPIALQKQLNEEKRIEKQKALDKEISDSGKTKEEYLRDLSKLFGKDSVDWSYADIARATSIGLDIASMLSAFLPGYGTAASAATGLSGTLASVSADISEGHGMDALKNLGVGLAFDVVGLIPGFGSAGKTAKMIKSAAKIAPKLLAVSSLTDPNILKSVKKLTTENGRKNITVEDWRNIASAIKIVTGVSSSATISAKRAAMRAGSSKTISDGKISLRTKSGKEITVGDGKDGTITLALFDEIKNAGSLKDAETILNGIKGFEKVKLAGTKLGLLPGITQKVAKSSFLEKQGTTKYNLEDVSGKNWSRFGNINDWKSDVALYNRHLYGGMSGINMSFLDRLNPFMYGMKRKTNLNNSRTSTKITTPLMDVSWKHMPNKTKFIDLREKMTDRASIARVRLILNLRNYKQNEYSINGLKPELLKRGINIGYDPKRVIWDKQHGGVYFWKQGGTINRINKVLKAQGGASVPFILKGQNGLNTNWLDIYKKRYNQQVLKYNGLNINDSNAPNASGRPTMGVSGYLGYGNDIYNLEAAYKAGEAYKSNKLNITNDILNYLRKINTSNLSDEELVKTYNDSASKIRNFWNTERDYNVRSDEIKNHNLLHKEMFASRNNAKGDATIGNVGWDDAESDRIGRSTWARRMDQYSDVFEGQEDRIHEIDLGNGRKIKVYKKYNGDIGIFDPNRDYSLDGYINTKVSINHTPGEEPLSDINNNIKTLIEGRNEIKEPKDYSKLTRAVLSSASEVFKPLRYLLTQRTNKLMRDKFFKDNRPVYIKPYETQGRVLGDFAFKSWNNEQAAYARRQGKPWYTSDSDKNMSYWMEANKLARELEEKGSLGYNQGIEKSMEDVLQRSDQGVANRTEVANKNNLSTKEWKDNIRKYEQEYLLAQHKNTDTFLQELQSYSQLKFDNWKQLYLEYQDLLNRLKVENELTPYKKALDDAYDSGDSTKIKEALNRYQLEYNRRYTQYLIDSFGEKYFVEELPFTLKYIYTPTKIMKT